MVLNVKNTQKLLGKSRLSGAIEKIPSMAIRNQAEKELEKLLKENDLSNRMLTKHLRESILPAIAVYGILLDHGWTVKDAYQLVRRTVLEASKPVAASFQRLGKLPFCFPLLRMMCPLSIQVNFGEAGWDFVWKENNRSKLEWHCHRCFYADVFARYHMPELTAIFCESDDVVYGNISGVRWGRTKTIGYGDDICDFRFYNDRSQGMSE